MSKVILTSENDHHLRQEIFRFRYRILVEEQHKTPCYADHLQQTVQEPLDEKGWLFVKEENETIHGTVRINVFSDLSDPVFLDNFSASIIDEFNLRKEAIVASRLIVSPAYRGTRVFTEFVTVAFREVLQRGRSLLIMECSPAYEPLFRKIGFTAFGFPFQHPDGMTVTPMVLDGNNKTYLQSIGSVCYFHYPESFIPDPLLSIAISTFSAKCNFVM